MVSTCIADMFKNIMFHWLTLLYTTILHGCPFALSWWTNSCLSFSPTHWQKMDASAFCPEQPFCRTNRINPLGNLHLDTLGWNCTTVAPPTPTYYIHLFTFPVVQADDVPQSTLQDLLVLQPSACKHACARAHTPIPCPIFHFTLKSNIFFLPSSLLTHITFHKWPCPIFAPTVSHCSLAHLCPVTLAPYIIVFPMQLTLLIWRCEAKDSSEK